MPGLLSRSATEECTASHPASARMTVIERKPLPHRIGDRLENHRRLDDWLQGAHSFTFTFTGTRKAPSFSAFVCSRWSAGNVDSSLSPRYTDEPHSSLPKIEFEQFARTNQAHALDLTEAIK